MREFPSEDCDLLFLLGKECHLQPPDAEGYGRVTLCGYIPNVFFLQV